MRIAGTIASLLLFYTFSTSAQSPVFSQYYTTGLYLNPAIAGSESESIFGLNYRAQWNQLESPYRTFQASYTQPFIKSGGRAKHKGGFGISLLNDQAGYGSLNNTGINLTGAYNLHFSEYGNNVISFGLQSGVYRTALDAGSLQWGSQYNSFTGFDPSIQVGDPQLRDQRTYVVFNTGLLWFYRKEERYSNKKFSTYLGASFYNLNQPNISLLNETSSVSISSRIHGGATFSISPGSDITPSFLVVNELSETQVNLGAYYTYRLRNSDDAAIILGGWYRIGDAVIAHAGTQIKRFRIAFSYDRNVSSFNRYFGNNGSFEFSLQYRIKRRQKSVYFSTPLI